MFSQYSRQCITYILFGKGVHLMSVFFNILLMFEFFIIQKFTFFVYNILDLINSFIFPPFCVYYYVSIKP